jgi:hypothetical protein
MARPKRSDVRRSRIAKASERLWKRYEACMNRCTKHTLKYDIDGRLVGVDSRRIGSCARTCSKRVARSLAKKRRR